MVIQDRTVSAQIALFVACHMIKYSKKKQSYAMFTAPPATKKQSKKAN